jgi:hypothetical protein
VRWLSVAEHPAKAHYIKLIEQRFRVLFHQANARDDAIGMKTIGAGLRALRNFAPDRREVVLNEHGPDAFVNLLLANGTLFELFSLLQHSTSGFRSSLLEQLTNAQAATMLDKTIEAGRSIGTLNCAMRELGQTDPDLLVLLEQAIGASGFMRLILANGTLSDLFKVLEFATSGLRSSLLEQLTSEYAEVLLNKTIAAGRSVGTLGLAMRELGETDPDLLARLEGVVGASGFMRLILANGTLFELFRVLEFATSGFRTSLLQQLTSEHAEVLLNKTIAAGRSIGTLSLAMRELSETDLNLLGQLERAIGAGGLVRLILANGTLFELFGVFQYATPGFRTALLEQLSTAQTVTLLDKTIAAGRSIGTLHLAMRELGWTDPDLLDRLEKAIGAQGFLRLILANGTLFELFKVIQYATPGFRTALLEQLTSEQTETLLVQTVAEARRIESLHFTLRILAYSPNQLTRLEDLLQVAGWWRLLIACGSLNSVSHLTQAMSSRFSKQIVAAGTNLSILDWRGIIERGLFLNACDFATNELLAYPEVSRSAFRAALAEAATSLAAGASWFDLNPSRPPAEPQNVEGAILRGAISTRMQALQLPELFGLDFRESVNALACCWRERPDLRFELGKNFHRILSPHENWPRENGEVSAIRLVLSLARNHEFPADEASWILSQVTAFLDEEVCVGIHTLPLFLLVWNMVALSQERDPERNCEEALPRDMQQLLIRVLAGRVNPKRPNQEKLAQFALAGLISFLFPEHKTQLAMLVAPLSGAARRLLTLAMEQTFVPAFFGLEGIALQTWREQVFSPANRAELLKKLEEYEDVGPALQRLRLHVSRTNME